MSRRFAFVFVAQQGELEIKASLLAASLKRHLRVEYELIAAMPQPTRQWGTISPGTLRFLEKLGARCVGIQNQIDPTYAIANKIGCLSIATAADKLIFLDSDMILMRDFVDEPRFDIAFNARPAAYPTFSKSDADWEKVYRACDAPMPATRVRTTYSAEYIQPYFNSAFVGVPGNSNFGDVWRDCCRVIDGIDGIPNKRPYLDQIALGVAAAKLKMEFDCLDESYNYPINFKPLDETNLPLICHYHDVPTLRREPAAVQEVQSLLQEDDDLRKILATHPAWAGLARQPAISRRIAITPELVITGIPRSGTSYLCNLLHRLDNCVVLNEPVEIPAALMEKNLPYGVARFFRDIRRDVLGGLPIRNKLVDGKVSEDTAIANDTQTYVPQVKSADFVLGVKATIAFLSRLPILRRVMPHARFVACVRNPLDCVASWKKTFEHLRNADVNGVNVGHANDPWLTGIQKKQLAQIAEIPDAPSRRAAWWNYLANLVIESLDDVILVRYEDLALHPNETLERILSPWPAGKALEPIVASTVRRRRENLEPDDITAVRALCRESAKALGLSID